MSEEVKKRLIIQSGKVFDSINGKLLENTTIAVKENKIVWVGDQSAFEKEENDEIIDATGKIILPGMIEAHVHLVATGNPQFERQYLRDLISRNRGRINKSSEEAGVSTRQLHKLMSKYGIRKEVYRSS